MEDFAFAEDAFHDEDLLSADLALVAALLRQLGRRRRRAFRRLAEDVVGGLLRRRLLGSIFDRSRRAAVLLLEHPQSVRPAAGDFVPEVGVKLRDVSDDAELVRNGVVDHVFRVEESGNPELVLGDAEG